MFLLNGYDDLDIFSELDDHDLDTLHISDQDQRNKLLSAAKVLGDWNGIILLEILSRNLALVLKIVVFHYYLLTELYFILNDCVVFCLEIC